MSTPTTTSTHLLRALLREASYLPDAYARRYFRKYIVSRFKAYQPAQNATASLGLRAVDKYRNHGFDRRPVSIIEERTRRLQQRAVKNLHFLQRANHGELVCLEKVLYMTYGRVGRRKHELLNDLLKPDAVMDGGRLLDPSELDISAPLQEHYHSDKRFLQYFDLPTKRPNSTIAVAISNRFSRLRSVVKSQQQAGLAIRREVKSNVVKMPEHNIWMRPMPLKRARNIVLRWYKETMTKLLVPIPIEEFDHIHAIIHRQKRVSLVHRRTLGTCHIPAEHLSTHEVDGLMQLLKLDKPSKAARQSSIDQVTHINVSLMRRLYSRVFKLCCKVAYDQERKKWTTTWGQADEKASKSSCDLPTDPELFTGVDTSGNVVRSTGS